MFLTISFGGGKEIKIKNLVNRMEEGKGSSEKKSSHHLRLSVKGGQRYQGVGAGDKAMVALGPNCLLGYGRVSSLRIPP